MFRSKEPALMLWEQHGNETVWLHNVHASFPGHLRRDWECGYFFRHVVLNTYHRQICIDTLVHTHTCCWSFVLTICLNIWGAVCSAPLHRWEVWTVSCPALWGWVSSVSPAWWTHQAGGSARENGGRECTIREEGGSWGVRECVCSCLSVYQSIFKLSHVSRTITQTFFLLSLPYSPPHPSSLSSFPLPSSPLLPPHLTPLPLPPSLHTCSIAV